MAIIVNHPLAKLTFEDGTPEETINQALVQLEAEYGEQYGTLETLGRGAERSFTAASRGLFGVEAEEGGMGVEEDLRRERERRIMQEQSPITSFIGEIGGALADPITLPAKVAKIPMTAVGAVTGATYGFLEPTYEEYGDSQVANTLFGAGFGGLLGGAGDLLSKYLRKQDPELESLELEEAADEAISNVGKQAAKMEAEDEAVDEVIDLAEDAATRPAEPEPQEVPVSNYQPSTPAPLPQKYQPKSGDTTIAFENDLDVALYKLGTPGAKPSKKLLDWTKAELDVDDTKLVLDSAKVFHEQTASGANGKIYMPGASTISQARGQRQLETRAVEEQGSAQLEELKNRQPTQVVELEELVQAGKARQSVGAAKVEPLDMPTDVPDETVQKVMQTPDDAPRPKGEAKPVSLPSAREDYNFISEEADNFFNKFLPAMAKGSLVRQGRQERRGKKGGGFEKQYSAGMKRAAKLAREAGSVEEYFAALRDVDASKLDPEDIVASAPVQAKIDRIVIEQTEIYNRAIKDYGSVENIPPNLQRDIVEATFKAVQIKRIISGSLTRASDMLNAQKAVNSLRRRERAITQLFGTRCY